MARPYVVGFVLVALSSVAAGVSWPINKLVLEEIDPWTLKAITVPCAGAILLAITHLAGNPVRPKRRDLGPLAAVAAFNISGWHLFVAFGLRESAASHAIIIAFTMPIWATLLSVWLLGEKIRPQSMLAFGLVGAAVLVVVGGNLANVADASVGPVLLLMAALSWAYGTIRQKRLKTDLGLTAVAAWQLLLGSIPIAFGMAIWGRPEELPTVSLTALSATGVVLVAMLFVYWAWFRIVDIFPAHVASISKVSTPVVGVVASGLILGEQLGPREWIALSLVVAGLPLLTLQKSTGDLSSASKPNALRRILSGIRQGL